MYGYIVPERSTLGQSDFVLYKSFYCGICCETGRLCGQFPRFTTNYDFAFLSALLHDYAQSDIVIEEHGCVLNPRHKAILQSNPLLTRLVYANIMLCYQKAEDGVRDGDGIKYRAVRSMLAGAVKKAAAECPELWARVKRFDEEQTAVEKRGESSIDRAADPFAAFMRELPEFILGRATDDNMRGLCYNIGKFVYIVDALDDIADDRKRRRYNPFLARYADGADKTETNAAKQTKRIKNFRKEFLSAHKEERLGILNSVCVRAEQCCDGLRFTQSRSLIENIVKRGMRAKTKELAESVKKLDSPRL